MDIVDIHPHVIASDTQRYPLVPVGGKISDWAVKRPVTGEQYLAAIDQAGIAQAALVQASTAHGYDNTYTADVVAGHPDRFAGVCCIDAMAPDAPAQLTYWVQERGMSGLRLFTTGSTMSGQSDWLNDPGTYPAWQRAGELNIPVCVQMQLSGAPLLRDMLERFPKVRVILDHMSYAPVSDGPPFRQAEPFFALAKFPNVYLKLTVRNFEITGETPGTAEPFFRKVVDTFGADRIAWGSNFPAAKESLPELLQMAKDGLAFLSPAEQQAIFAGTARTLYPTLAANANRAAAAGAGW